ncbi:MAG: hypothetical protein EXQ84_04970 [Rhodospirillaceae bacterium]|nr:hypothetical protein [Rhodospirillaceae bacterium]
MIPGFVQGIGMAMFFIPSSMLAYESLPKHLFDGAAGLYSVMRTIGGSVGIATIGLLLTRRADYHWRILGEHVTPDNPNVHAWLNNRGLSLGDPGAAPLLVGETMKQAQVMAFGDMYLLVALLTLALAPIVLFMRKPAKRGAPQPAE